MGVVILACPAAFLGLGERLGEKGLQSSELLVSSEKQQKVLFAMVPSKLTAHKAGQKVEENGI